MKSINYVALLLLLTPLACTSDDPSPYAEMSFLVLMTAVITPASDTLWGVEDPQTDAEWKVLEDAALAAIAAGQQVQKGGTGPNDNAWAAEAEWQGYAKEMTKAAEDGLQAIRDRNLDTLYAANDVLYPPCENCHLKFNPAVVGEQE